MQKIISTKLSFKLWLTIIIFGLFGQMAWIIENMYFPNFLQTQITSDSTVSAIMVAAGAIVATISTIWGGSITDRLGKRKIFISIGYILWGIVIIFFSSFKSNPNGNELIAIVSIFIFLDCVMTFIGSWANDACFNAWVTDITDSTNRGKTDTVLAIMPVASMLIVFGLLNELTMNGNWKIFFLILGIVIISSGIIGIFLIKDSKYIVRAKGDYWQNVFYGFKKEIIIKHKNTYICFAGIAIIGTAIQVYQAYLLTFIQETLKLNDYVILLGSVVVLSAIGSVIFGNMMDKYGKAKFFIPTVIMYVVGGVSAFFLKFTEGVLAKSLLLGFAATLVMGASLIMTGLLISTSRDYTPLDKAGGFQGIRMVFHVLIPMIIGPFIGDAVIKAVNLTDPITGNQLYPCELFLVSAIVSLFTLIPIFYIKRNMKRDKPIAREEILEYIP